ncbi:MAG: hypothetical protein CL920_37765 [Deltaproteobacteria bacterium]|nr:hypothetical protein [Deltaproteobacteria bacterium]MBU54480.1 hypothetical protein [Deltaproteobacteria bacterium]
MADDQVYKQIETMYLEGRLQDALALCEQHQEASPDDTALLTFRAGLHQELHEFDASISWYVKLVKAYAEQGEFLKAISTAKELTGLSSEKGEEMTQWLAAQYSEQYGNTEPSTLTSMPSFSKTPIEEDASVQELKRQIEESGSFDEEAGEATMLSPSPFELQRLTSSSGKESSTEQDSPLPPLFNQLDAQSITSILTRMSRRRFAAGDEIIRQGEVGNTFYIILKGSVRIVHRVDDFDEEVGVLAEGQFFGEIALLTPLRRTATVLASENSELLELNRDDLQSIIEHSPHVYDELQRFVYQRLIQNLLMTSLLFFPIPDHKRWELAERFTVTDAKLDETLLAEEQPADALYLIAGGEVGIYKSRPDGEQTLLSRIGPGQFFGELALLTKKPSTCSFVSLEACSLLKLKAEDFFSVMKEFPRVYELLKAVARERHTELQAFESIWRDLSPSRTPIT